MTATISGSVGRAGDNRTADVAAVQKLLGMAASGKADAGTLAAIEAFQRDTMKLAAPDGRIDPGGRTLKALAALAPNGTVTYAATLDAESRIVSPYAIKVIEKAVAAAGFKAAVITSTLRTPARQAATMYDMAMQDLAAQRALYGAAGDQVLAVFAAERDKPKAQVLAKMQARIEDLLDQGVRVSNHVVRPQDYARLNVIDIGMASTQAAAGASYATGKLTAAFTGLVAAGYVRKFIDETAKSNHCWHVEIAPGAKGL
jgi:hypothetical protein